MKPGDLLYWLSVGLKRVIAILLALLLIALVVIVALVMAR
jgi:hypothetical protein